MVFLAAFTCQLFLQKATLLIFEVQLKTNLHIISRICFTIIERLNCAFPLHKRSRRLLNFEASNCAAYRNAVLKKGDTYFRRRVICI